MCMQCVIVISDATNNQQKSFPTLNAIFLLDLKFIIPDQDELLTPVTIWLKAQALTFQVRTKTPLGKLKPEQTLPHSFLPVPEVVDSFTPTPPP